ncbi:MAG: hypothetical protein RBT76_08760 [candidate division Zixibacteria bacterium]|jgi:hypothetical protein|nr:hypothetical protein [candidate division Zixibacteria bacterium]
MFTRVSSVLVALALLWVVGCSSVPTEQIATTDKAFESAKAAEAEQYAAMSFQMAMDTLNAAKVEQQAQDGKFSLLRSYDKSRDLYAAAERLAAQAVTDAAAEKQRVQEEVRTLLADAETLMATVDAAVKAAPVAKGTRADIELLKADFTAAQTSFSDARADFDAGSFLTARTKANSTMEKLQSIMTQIEEAKARKTTRSKT